MNADNYTSYSLTHQVLYYLVGIGVSLPAYFNPLESNTLCNKREL